MQKKGSGFAVSLVIVLFVGLGVGVFGTIVSLRADPPQGKDALIAEIMDIPQQMDKNGQAFKDDTKKYVNKYKGLNDELLITLKSDLRKLHAIDPALADKIVDENFPRLMAGKNPLWIRKVAAAPAPVPAVPAPAAAVKK